MLGSPSPARGHATGAPTATQATGRERSTSKHPSENSSRSSSHAALYARDLSPAPAWLAQSAVSKASAGKVFKTSKQTSSSTTTQSGSSRQLPSRPDPRRTSCDDSPARSRSSYNDNPFVQTSYPYPQGQTTSFNRPMYTATKMFLGTDKDKALANVPK